MFTLGHALDSCFQFARHPVILYALQHFLMSPILEKVATHIVVYDMICISELGISGKLGLMLCV